MSQNQQREQLGSRIGFLLLAAGCAIGLGNVWRFPISQAYGGAVRVHLYRLPAGGRRSHFGHGVLRGRAARNLGAALQSWTQGSRAGIRRSAFSLIGSYLLMMFYTVAGWMLAYCWSMIKGDLSGLTPEQVGGFFGGLISDPTSSASGWARRSSVLPCAAWACAGVERGQIHDGRPVRLMIALVVVPSYLPGAKRASASTSCPILKS